VIERLEVAGMSGMHAVVVGGGVGGLTAAVALHQQGRSVTVCEQAPSLEPVGSGISLAPNALRALDVIGLGKQARELAAIQGVGGIRRSDGAWLVRTDMQWMVDRYGDPFVIALRAELVALLVAALPEGSVLTGTPVRGVDAATGVVTLDNGELTADLVVAADGIRSPIRGSLFPQHPGPRYSGATTWRFVVPEPVGGYRPSETWGNGDVFGIMPLSSSRVYCYASALTPPGIVHEDERAELLRRFGDWHEPIGELLRSADTAQVLHNDVHTIADPLPAYHSGKVALLGDAVHAMSPNLGQGGCQAIEDAVVLAHEVSRTDHDLPAALQAYTAARKPRTEMIVRRSRKTARMAGLSFPPAVLLRNTALHATARFATGAMMRQMTPLVDWTPPHA
jgi:2-polyprenyl-6-methoxyphenol hydroxylase-like FAD-dependent oxidoreductase